MTPIGISLIFNCYDWVSDRDKQLIYVFLMVSCCFCHHVQWMYLKSNFSHRSVFHIWFKSTLFLKFYCQFIFRFCESSCFKCCFRSYINLALSHDIIIFYKSYIFFLWFSFSNLVNCYSNFKFQSYEIQLNVLTAKLISDIKAPILLLFSLSSTKLESITVLCLNYETTNQGI